MSSSSNLFLIVLQGFLLQYNMGEYPSLQQKLAAIIAPSPDRHTRYYRDILTNPYVAADYSITFRGSSANVRVDFSKQ